MKKSKDRLTTTVRQDDYTITVDATSGPVTVTLPPAEVACGRTFIVYKKDSSGNAVTVAPPESYTIQELAGNRK